MALMETGSTSPPVGRQLRLFKVPLHGSPSTVVVLPNCGDIQCLLQEGKQNYTYYVVPEILHWEDRNTEWSGIPDRVEIKLVVYDTLRSELASVVVSGKSKWATFGGDHPEDLLPEPLRQYVESLY